ncbi:hypothetical protein IWQ60_004405 [Tieghemiomyces parasiticus]|uniref:Uncharacterized protein n=1 Tax=Tieghemiomyces parasiticus TaxID=78921 RepID=A0A9W8DTX9_9FUNG|nr:hypothetical protein IWQ60_004405 [Tieghemiomyces parasiticus]
MTVANTCHWAPNPTDHLKESTSLASPTRAVPPREPRHQLVAPRTLAFRPADLLAQTRRAPAPHDTKRPVLPTTATALGAAALVKAIPQDGGDAETSRGFILEYSVHACSPRFRREVALVFPQFRTLNSTKPAPAKGGKGAAPTITETSDLYIVPVCQPTHRSLVAVGAEIEGEKDDKLINFVRWADCLRALLAARGYWADFTDPCSGYPVYSPRGASFYPDVAGCQYLLRYAVTTADGCSVLVHPRWDTSFYPATFFTTAPPNVIEAAVQQMATSQ